MVALYCVTVFVSAFLLFQVQPLIGKYILPWFGSSPGVWATCLLFFQVLLLGGYAYAHFLVSRLRPRRQALLHVSLLALALLTLPITPAEGAKPPDADAPIVRILLVLAASVGIPYLLLSATGPLLQGWFARLRPQGSPYRLYALSNAGSLLALVSYPFVVEPRVRLRSQTVTWSLLFAAFAVLCAVCAWARTRVRSLPADEPAEDAASRPEPAPKAREVGLWLLLSACGSGLLLATTNQMCLDVAVIPFLWVIPLSLYLLSFVLTFDSDRWYARPLFFALLPFALGNAVRVIYGDVDLTLTDQIVSYSACLFVCCMCCHGELSRAKPGPRHLTFFFLIVSIGGALGGLFVAVLAPAVFSNLYEYPLLLILAYGLVVAVMASRVFGEARPASGSTLRRVLAGAGWTVGWLGIAAGALLFLQPSSWSPEEMSRGTRAALDDWRSTMKTIVYAVPVLSVIAWEILRRRRGKPWRAWWRAGPGMRRWVFESLGTLGLVALVGSLFWTVHHDERRHLARDRNFYGVLSLRVYGEGDLDEEVSLRHGRIRHGQQMKYYASWPTAYYGPLTGVGLAIRHHPHRDTPGRAFRIGMVGLGTGTIAAYGNATVDPYAPKAAYVRIRPRDPPDVVRFYELNPMVARWAESTFTYLSDARRRGAKVDVLLGDARIVLERQARAGDLQAFDVLAIDAFSSDAIPIHLLTRESVAIYKAHLQPDGILAIHITNRFVDLLPVVCRLAQEFGYDAIYVDTPEDSEFNVSSCDWVLLTTNRAFLEDEDVRLDEEPLATAGPLWTDDFSSVFDLLRFRDDD